MLLHFAAWGETPQYKVESYPSICDDINNIEKYDTTFLQKHWKIIAGEEDWLANSSMDFPNYGQATSNFSLQELSRLKALLAEYGTELMIVYLPSRGLSYPDELSASTVGYDVKSQRQHYLNTLNAIRKQGIAVPQMTSLFDINSQEPIFYEKDIHWSIKGAQEAAKLVATDCASVIPNCWKAGINTTPPPAPVALAKIAPISPNNNSVNPNYAGAMQGQVIA